MNHPPTVPDTVKAFKTGVYQNYIRNETITDANSILVSAHNHDGMRFVVPVRHYMDAALNPLRKEGFPVYDDDVVAFLHLAMGI
jgi:hypothetical protein